MKIEQNINTADTLLVGLLGEKLLNYFYEGVSFIFKQASACIFGGFMLTLMIATYRYYPIESLHRYDFLFLSAIAFQIGLIFLKGEKLKEVKVIFLFHVVATLMELFKTHDSIGSWKYPEEFYFGIATVPLFTGFLYSSVGSYLARVWRIFDFHFSYFPKKKYALILVIAVYLNFFTHHFIYDFRWVLLGFTIYLFYRTEIYFKIINNYRRMPLLIGFLLVAFFIWIGENIGTFTKVWLYPNQYSEWQMVSFGKLSSWYLLMLLSFVLVAMVNQIKIIKNK